MNREERRRRAKLGEVVDAPDEKSLNAAKARVRAAEKRLDDGEIDLAKSALEEAMLLDPTNPRACYLSAMIALNAGDLPIAQDHILTAATHDDDDPNVHANCSAIMNLAGRPLEAEAAARHAVSLAPDMAEAHCNLGVALEAQGKLPDAIAALKRAIKIRPTYADALISLGNLNFRSGDFISAVETFADAVRAWPENAMARTNLAIALRHLGELGAAEEQCLEAIQLDSGYAEAYNALGNVYLQLGNLPDAVAAFEKASERREDYPEAMANLAGALFRSGLYSAAESAFLRTLDKFPTFSEASHGLGVVYLAQGKFEDALVRFRAAAETRPGFGEAWMNIVDASDGDISDDDLKILKENSEDARLPAEDRIGFSFALGKAFDARGDFNNAYDAFIAGNKRRSELISRADMIFDADSLDDEISKVIKLLDQNLIRKLEVFGDHEARPVFVCGMPRSGTTLVEQLISSHPSARGAGEVDIISGLLDAFPEDAAELDQQAIKELSDLYIRRLPHSLRDGQVVVDKTPQNVFYLGLIKILFPMSKILRCTRDPHAVAWSCYTQNFRSSNLNWSCDLDDISRFASAEERVVAHWKPIFGDQMVEVSYEDLIGDFENQARRILDVINLPWDDAVLKPHLSDNSALTASNWQVRKPLYTTAIDQWKNYKDRLVDIA